MNYNILYHEKSFFRIVGVHELNRFCVYLINIVEVLQRSISLWLAVIVTWN